MDTTSIKGVLFDFGGVLAEEGFRDGLRVLAEQQGRDPDMLTQEGRRAVHDSGFVTGHGDESDFWDLLRRRTGISGSDAALSAEILNRFVLRPWMFEQVAALRRGGLLVAILSDQTEWLERLDQAHGLYAKFDRVFNSYRLGKTKHDPTLFDEVLAALELPPSAVLFIDDKEELVRTARDRGLVAVHYQRREEVEGVLRGLARRAAREFVPR